MTMRTILLGSVAALAFTMFTPDAAYAQNTCGEDNFSDEPGPNSIACGDGATANGSSNTAVGGRADASGTRPLQGPDAVTLRGNTAIGGLALARGNEGGNIAIGFANASGNNAVNIAIGDNAFAASANGGRIAIGADANASNSATMALGWQAAAQAEGSIAIGFGTRALAQGSVALGNGSLANEALTVSLGNAGLQRRIVNLAAGNISATSTDAVNGSQIFNLSTRAEEAFAAAQTAQNTAEIADARAQAAQQTANTALANANQGISDAAAAQGTADAALANAAVAQQTADIARTEAAAAQGTANTAVANAAAAQTTANSALANANAVGTSTASALGGGSSYNPATGLVSAPSYTIGGQSYNNVGSALSAVDNRLTLVTARVDALEADTALRFRQADGGIAAAMAMGGTMIVPDSDVSLSFNVATYRGEQGFSAAAVIRASDRLYVSGGVAGSTVSGSTGGRIGVAIGF